MEKNPCGTASPKAANPDRVIRLTMTIPKKIASLPLNLCLGNVKISSKEIGTAKGHKTVAMTKTTIDRKLSSTEELRFFLKNLNQLIINSSFQSGKHLLN
jgi:hypothetical protein